MFNMKRIIVVFYLVVLGLSCSSTLWANEQRLLPYHLMMDSNGRGKYTIGFQGRKLDSEKDEYSLDTPFEYDVDSCFFVENYLFVISYESNRIRNYYCWGDYNKPAEIDKASFSRGFQVVVSSTKVKDKVFKMFAIQNLEGQIIDCLSERTSYTKSSLLWNWAVNGGMNLSPEYYTAIIKEGYPRLYHGQVLDGEKGFYGFVKNYEFVSTDEMVEVKGSDGNIYSHAAALTSRNKDIYFYAEGMNAFDGSTTEVIYDAHYRSAYVHMNKIKVKDHIANLWDCIKDVDHSNAILVAPRGYFFLNNSKLLLVVTITYKDHTEITETIPTYVLIGGSAIQVDDGTHEKVYTRDRSYLVLLDSETLQHERTIPFPDVENPLLFYSKDGFILVNKKRYVAPNSHYNYGYDEYSISDNQSSIYFISPEWAVSKFIPEKGETLLDIADVDDNHYVLCGTTKSHGYIDYNNPLVLVIDKEDHQSFHYYGDVNSDTKDVLYVKMQPIRGDWVFEKHGASGGLVFLDSSYVLSSMERSESSAEMIDQDYSGGDENSETEDLFNEDYETDDLLAEERGLPLPIKMLIAGLAVLLALFLFKAIKKRYHKSKDTPAGKVQETKGKAAK